MFCIDPEFTGKQVREQLVEQFGEDTVDAVVEKVDVPF